MALTISPSAERLGAQRPRLLHVPEFVSSTGEEACELAAMAGLEMDPWQQFVLTNALGERPDGLWAAKEVGVEVPRQNGKGGFSRRGRSPACSCSASGRSSIRRTSSLRRRRR
jgi:hypothetical protein